MTFTPRPLRHKTFPLRETIFTLCVVLFLVGVFSFSLFQARRLLEGPVVILDQGENGSLLTSTSQVLTLSGTTENIAFMWVNGKQVYANPDGTFTTSLLAPIGSSILEVRARDKAKNERVTRMSVFVETPTAVAAKTTPPPPPQKETERSL